MHAYVLRGQRLNDDERVVGYASIIGFVMKIHEINLRITSSDERSVTVTQPGGYSMAIGQFRLYT